MTIKILEEFSVGWMQVLDETGKVDHKLMPKLEDVDMLHMYEYMVATRMLDDKMFKLQRQGRMGTIAQSLGQEASTVGSAYAMEDDDWAFPSFREHGVHLVKHYPIHQYMQYWAGDERGAHVPPGVNIFTVAIPVGSQIPHAAGLAWAMKMKQKPSVAVAYFGDGATSRGDFHEGLNFAGVFKLPVVFICQNNQWAISLPVSKQTASKTLAQKAIAYGFNGIRVDGNDIFAVYKATKEAVEHARAGKGPTLIECLTYRISDHTTSDDAKKYRNEEEVEKWKRRDPIARLEKYLIAKGILDDAEKDKIRLRAESNIEAATKRLEAIPAPDPEDMFKFVFENMTPEMKEQLDEVKRFVGNANTDNSTSS